MCRGQFSPGSKQTSSEASTKTVPVPPSSWLLLLFLVTWWSLVYLGLFILLREGEKLLMQGLEGSTKKLSFFILGKKSILFFFSWSDICLKGFPVYWCVDMSCGFIEEPGKNDQLFGLRVEEIRKNRSVHSTLGIQNCGKCLMWSNFLISVTKCLDGCSWKKEMVWLAFQG